MHIPCHLKTAKCLCTLQVGCGWRYNTRYMYQFMKLINYHYSKLICNISLFSSPKSEGMLRHRISVGRFVSVTGFCCPLISPWLYLLPYHVLEKTCTILHIPKLWVYTSYEKNYQSYKKHNKQICSPRQRGWGGKLDGPPHMAYWWTIPTQLF